VEAKVAALQRAGKALGNNATTARAFLDASYDRKLWMKA
jgi:hypothetical protein